MHKLVYVGIAIAIIIVSYYIVMAFVLQQQSINKQSVYVHLDQGWASYPGNIVYDITNVWSGKDAPKLSPQERLELSKQNNVEQIRYAHGKPYILVQNSNTNCKDSWEPHYARFGADTVRHYIEYATGVQQNPDPNINLYTLQTSRQETSQQQMLLKSGYSQFIPICTSKEKTSFDYSVKINDSKVGFDVYFVDSKEQQENYDSDNGKFQYYDSCFGKNYERFSGTCNNVGKNAGLLIAIPDKLSLPVTKIQVWLYEK